MVGRAGNAQTRIFELFPERSLSDWARLTGLSESTLSLVRSGKRSPGSHFVASVLTALGTKDPEPYFFFVKK